MRVCVRLCVCKHYSGHTIVTYIDSILASEQLSKDIAFISQTHTHTHAHTHIDTHTHTHKYARKNLQSQQALTLTSQVDSVLTCIINKPMLTSTAKTVTAMQPIIQGYTHTHHKGTFDYALGCWAYTTQRVKGKDREGGGEGGGGRELAAEVYNSLTSMRTLPGVAYRDTFILGQSIVRFKHRESLRTTDTGRKQS